MHGTGPGRWPTSAASARPTRRQFAALAAASVAGSVTACGSDTRSPNTPDGVLSGDLLVWTSFTQGPRAEWMQQMARAFESAHPDVRVTIETFSWPDFYTKWTMGLAAGQVPDLSSALPTHVAELLDVDALVPLDDVIDQIGRDRFAAAALAEGEMGGANYSMPLYTHAQVMWYRTDLLDQAGLEVPSTWEELRHAAEVLTTDDVYGLSVPMGSGDMMATRFLNYYVQSAGDRLLNDDGSANLTSQAVLDGIAYWVDMYHTVSPEGSINYDVLQQATLYYEGKTAFDFNSGFQISGVQQSSPELVEYVAAAPLPRLNDNDSLYGGETSNTPMIVWEASDMQEEAKAFLRSLYQTEEYIEFLHSVPGGMLPALSDISDDPGYLDDPVLEQFADTVEVIDEAVPLGTAIGMENGPTVQASILTSQGIVERLFQDIVLTGTPVPEAAQAAEEQLNSLFEMAGVEMEH
ncbi:ABC transporter substrate-binding protein [Ruania albidiflava]|uniref:ABC transporter substrate-binding protein n=1 Tax=Ruania albidiflava TaxID=366586 RepID=UPI0003B305AE